MKGNTKKRILSLALALTMVLGVAVTGGVKVSASQRTTLIEDSETTTTNELFKFQYSNGWASSTGITTSFSNGDEHYSNTAGAYFEFAFIGTKIEIYATKASNHGNYDVYMDGVKVGEANATIASGRENKQLIYTSEELADGQHTMKVELPSDDTNAIQVDYVVVTHGEIAPTGLVLSESEIGLECGKTKEITANVQPGYATAAEIEWSSSDESVATVENGVITAVAEERSSAVITAEIRNTDIFASVEVNVFPKVEYLGAFVGSCDTLDIQEDYEQYLTEFKDSWSDIAWKGDVLTSKIVTTSREETVTNAEIIASDFVDEKGHVISAEHVDIKWLKNIEANIGRGNSSAPVKEFPDVIYKGGKLDIAPNTLQSAWISIHIPEDAKAGTYQGTITVRADGLETPYIFDYEFQVLNLVQPTTEEMGTQIQLWQHPFSVANYYLGLGSQSSGGVSNEIQEDFYFTEEHLNLMRESMRDYASIGGHDVVANIVEEAWGHQSYYNDLSMVKWTKKADGTFNFDYDWYDTWINFMIETGVLDPESGLGMIKCYSIVPWNNQITYYDETTGNDVSQSYVPGNDDWREIWTIFLEDFMEHSKEKGWFEITYISMDERSMGQLEPAVELIASVQDENGKSFKISSAFNYHAQSDYSFSDQIHDVSINLGNVSNSNNVMRDFAEHRKELGLLTTIYTCTGNYPGNFTISDPAENMWTMWYSLAHGTDGFMRWAYDNYVYDMLGNVTYRYWEPGDGWFIYPVSREEAGDMTTDVGFYSTPRYEMLKKGLRDINKAKYLMSLSEELKEEVTALAESIEQPRQGSSYGSAVAATEEDRHLMVSEANRMRSTILEISQRLQQETSETGYAVALSGNTEVNVGEDVAVTFEVYSTEDIYNTYHYVLNYDPDILTYKSATEGAIVSAEEGVLTVLGYGEDKEITETVTVIFTAVAPGDVRVLLDNACVDRAENAITQNAPEAIIENAAVNIHIGGYTVNLSNDFTGDGSVGIGEDYHFAAKDPYYIYEITATMGGHAATVVENGDGTYSIENVTGDLLITANKMPMSFSAEAEGSGSADVTLSGDTAVYMSDYTFELEREEGYQYTVEVTVGGASCSPEVEGDMYQIPGRDIKGDIVIMVTKTVSAADTTQIIFSGNGSGDVVGNNPAIADNNENFTFTIDREEYYDYTVRLEESLLELTPDNEGVYIIHQNQLTGQTLTVVVTKTSTVETTVEAGEYVKLQDGRSMFLITVSGPLVDGEIFAYGENAMSYSEAYEAYVYLVISGQALAEVQAEAESMITKVNAEKAVIAYDGDVNRTGRTDINDAQLTYNMYNAYYSDFGTVSMEKFLRADVNHDKTLTVSDSAAIIEIFR